ncbi:epidermal growth factor receptor-like isoform X2 [Penaeus japonicus]|uniref:epidermal growth factor receptor-like isoform X2 n=1 Tax=Penaeus japonicus TaxID=27405 RepID=UPI001C70FAC3|nr:epidermal growth factor receptor-like isoform X2 [Penaeus japonicus]
MARVLERSYLLLAVCAAFALALDDKATDFGKGKICIGTTGRMSVPSNREHHYRNLRDRYINCTYVDGNLELTWLQDENLDLSFLQYIREVTGYVLISHVDVKKIVLPSLQIVRGQMLFKLSVHDQSFALLVTLSKMHTLEMPALRDILEGGVGVFNNYNLCHMETIEWKEIMTDPNGKYIFVYNFTEPQRVCSCHKSCKKGCWGEGPHNCQKFSKLTCSPQCHQGRCYGPGPRDCCHLFCAGGCSGPTQSDCLACRNFYDDGECKQECPPMQKYDTISYSWVTNPYGKYAYGATCVKSCPEHLLRDNGACVRTCPKGKKAVDGECVPCNGPCPKTCFSEQYIHAGNIDSFKGCTIIQGSMTILDHSFDGFQEVYDNFTFGQRYPKMKPSKLEVFSTLKEVTGHINIQASHPEFTNLSFLRNLEVIGGRDLTEYFSSLYIVKTSLKSLNLRSLRKIRSGKVYILENKDLCFVDKINWKKLIEKSDDSSSELLLQNNRASEQCMAEGLVCHSECSGEGCWGTRDDECLSCRSFKLGERCVNNCHIPGIYQMGPKECSFCHSECDGSCHGPDSNHCDRCKNVMDGPYCVDRCPDTKFDDEGICRACHENCVGGCTGPENTIGEGGCNSCEKAVINGDLEVEYCLHEKEACPTGYFSEWVAHLETGALRRLAGKTICRRCHPRCKNCTANGFHISVCHECVSYRRGEHCEDECPADHYADEKLHECFRCSPECSHGCTGPLESHCTACRNYRIYLDGEPGMNNTNFNCTASCPSELPYKIFPEDASDPYCGKDPLLLIDEESIPAILGGTLGCVFLLCIFLAVFCYLWWQRNKTKAAALKMTMTMMPYDDNEPLKPTNIKPNLAKLRIVKEAELRKGGILGYGAFGTVYKGVWVPEGENVKIPVAIKVLREGTGTNVNKEILEEAYIMASVDHPNLLQLLAVCMTTQIMLVTQLMPLGCLLDYVRNNKDKVGSKPLLNWCTQIARGMAYLEDRRLVHRDLAARNVLVQTPNCVKITDFGLAKLLDYNEEEYKAAGGKMPIKWLALECIQHRIFTHKSDVWAFGVTVWEILTYGGRPYEDIPAREVPDLLEKGERLPQPAICTIDVYMLMIRCWMLDAESRPSFRELAEEFAKMARDPGRFLVIPGDKLMRLPSYTPQDERELIRSLSSAIEGDGVVMAAEEYLQPKYGTGSVGVTGTTTTSSTSSSNPTTPVKKTMGGYSTGAGAEYISDRAESPQNRHNLQRERKYAHLEAGAAGSPGQRPRGDSLTSRYCTDPLKMLDADVGDDECFNGHGPPPSAPGYGWVGDLRLDLPVDEDDYLMPSPQPSGLATMGPSHQHYMDLMADNPDGRRNDHMRAYKGPNGTAGQWVGMDNPEYHMMNNRAQMHAAGRRIHPQQTVGVPVLEPGRFSSYGGSSGHSSVSSNGGPQQHQHHHPHPPEMAHEYYNEISPHAPHTQHALAARSETTV